MQGLAVAVVYLWPLLLIAAVVVAVVGFKTKSMAWCIVSGVVSLAIVMYVPGLIM